MSFPVSFPSFLNLWPNPCGLMLAMVLHAFAWAISLRPGPVAWSGAKPVKSNCFSKIDLALARP